MMRLAAALVLLSAFVQDEPTFVILVWTWPAEQGRKTQSSIIKHLTAPGGNREFKAPAVGPFWNRRFVVRDSLLTHETWFTLPELQLLQFGVYELEPVDEDAGSVLEKFPASGMEKTS